MSGRNHLAGEVDDPIVAEALKHFKAGVDAWSDAVYARPRTTGAKTRLHWRLAASWALGCFLVSASLAGTLYERHERQQSAHIAAIKAAEQKTVQERKAVEQPVAASTRGGHHPSATKRAADEDEDLLATVDSDVSRQVPSAMEPLAQMMDSSGVN